MTRRFAMQRGNSRIVFGRGSSSRIEEELATLGAERVLLVSTPGRKKDAEALAAGLGARSAGVMAIAREHVPRATVTEGLKTLASAKADALLAFGGGSAIGLAKALAVESPRETRIIAVPTTYSGSEMTPVFGITDGDDKRVAKDARARPALVIYDPDLLANLPRDTALCSLWNAMAHAVEALWANEPDRGTLLSAEESVRLLWSALSRLSVDSTDQSACELGLEGAFLAGAVFADVGGAVHHKLCHVLGGTLGLAHAATHAVLLPHVVRVNAAAAPEAMSAIARAIGAIDPVAAFARLSQATAPRGLAALGMKKDGIAAVVDVMMKSPAFSPRAIDHATLTSLLSDALEPAARPEAPRVRAPADIGEQRGFGGTHDSEALPGALPTKQNTPHPAPYGLLPECVNGTPFTVKSAENARTFMYRVRASFSHGKFQPLPHARFACALGKVEHSRTRWRPLPMPDASSRTDFLDGLVTLGGAGDPVCGPGYALHLYAANADMADRSFSNSDGDMLIVPQTGRIDVRTELGWLSATPGTILVIPRAIKFTVGLPEGQARGWMLEVFGPRIRLPERGPIGSNGLADARHFRAPVASYEDRECPGGFDIVTKLGGDLSVATQHHSPFDVVAWHGTLVPYAYDLSLFNAMGSVTWDHVDPSVLTVLTAPLDDKGRAVCDFVAFTGRWMAMDHSFRPPYMHRNAASEINCVVSVKSVDGGYEPGVTFLSPLLTAHGVATHSYDRELDRPVDPNEKPFRVPDESLWVMFESALPFRTSTWAATTPLVDEAFLDQFEGMKKRFDPTKP